MTKTAKYTASDVKRNLTISGKAGAKAQQSHQVNMVGAFYLVAKDRNTALLTHAVLCAPANWRYDNPSKGTGGLISFIEREAGCVWVESDKGSSFKLKKEGYLTEETFDANHLGDFEKNPWWAGTGEKPVAKDIELAKLLTALTKKVKKNESVCAKQVDDFATVQALKELNKTLGALSAKAMRKAA